MQDAMGIYGGTLHYALVIAFTGSAFMLFVYLQRKGLLNWDESAKYQMLQEDEHHE